MRYRRLGSSHMNVSALAFGGWQIGDPGYWGEFDQKEAAATVDAAIDGGINFFDTAEMYGNGESESVLGGCLAGKRDRVWVASKVWVTNCAPKKLKSCCEASLRRLGIDTIDLYQVHWPSRDVPFEDTYEALDLLRQEGKIRAVGLSNFGACDLDAWFGKGTAVSNQLGYNLLFRAIEYAVAPACIKYDLGILCYMPLLQGILSGRWKTADEIPMLRRRTRHFDAAREGVRHGEPGCEALTLSTVARLAEVADELAQPLAAVALAWLLTKPSVSSVILGARNVSQLLRNLPAADLELSPEVVSRLDVLSDPLKQQLGENPDMWQNAAHSRIR